MCCTVGKVKHIPSHQLINLSIKNKVHILRDDKEKRAQQSAQGPSSINVMCAGRFLPLNEHRGTLWAKKKYKIGEHHQIS
jgi:hypothetical protein